MRLKSSLLGFLATFLLLFSCKKEVSVEDGKLPGEIETTWEFTSDGTLFNGDMDSAFIQNAPGLSALTMVGSRPTEPGEFILQVVAETIDEGQYDGSQVAFQYSEGGKVIYQRVPNQSGTFSLTITNIDSAEVSGTFSGTAYDTLGQPHDIIDGAFTSPLNSGFDPDPTEEDGQLTVWAESLCTDGSSIEVLVGDQRGFISEGTLDEPECGDPRTATFTLPQGFYTVLAICGTDTVSYNVNVNAACVKLKVDIEDEPLEGDYLPLTVGSFWDYTNLDPNSSVTHRVTAGLDTIIDQKRYWMHISNLPDTFYYRKEGSVYFETLKVDFNGAVTNPPEVELIILNDELAAGQSWEVDGIPLSLSGISVLAKFESTILQRDFSASIEGVNYDNLIEVQTELSFSTDGGANYIPASSYVRVFAKGKGIIYYFDLERGIEWGATSINIVP